MEIDSFLKPQKPGSINGKRKLPTPDFESLKKTRVEDDVDVHAPKTSHAIATVQDFDDDGNPIGPAKNTLIRSVNEDGFQDGTAESFNEGDDRFFGSGLTEEQAKILDIMDDDEGQDEVIDVQGIRKLILRLEKAFNKNQDMRMKYSNDPAKFVDSEADLDAAIKAMMVVTQCPHLYSEIVDLGTVTSILSLLSHENTDIAIDTIELLNEMTDEDITSGDMQNNSPMKLEIFEKGMQGMKTLIGALLEGSLLDLLVSNLNRLDEKEDTDKQGVFFILSVFENLTSFDPQLSERVVQKTPLLTWLLNRITTKGFDQNKQFASELIAIILQTSTSNRLELCKTNGIDTVLQALAVYRKKNPVDDDEIEYMENLFDALCSGLTEDKAKADFIECEGVELMVLMMKQKLMSRHRAIKVLDYALATSSGRDNCVRFVEALGLKTLFSAFMSKGVKKHHKKTENDGTGTRANALRAEEEEHILGILGSLLNNLPASNDNPCRLRLMAKFAEEDYAKITRLLELRHEQVKRLEATDRSIAREREELEDDDIDQELTEEFYIRRLEGGLFTLQQIDLIIGWICAEDDGMRTHIRDRLKIEGGSLNDVRVTLKDMLSNLGQATKGNQREIIETLHDALEEE